MKRICSWLLAAALLAPLALMPLAATLRGDGDGDGSVTSTDARLTLQYSVGKIGENDLDLKACDADGDGKVTSTDARLILQMSVGKIDLAKYIPLYPWAEDLPRMDGSTSTVPLEAGIRAALFGISPEEAEEQVKHTTTYGSYDNLVAGNCDLIFSVPLSDEQIAGAKEKGKILEMEKIAAEGFVFVVNAQNPVDSLTRQQLRDIYSGKITNWKEVGGNDAPIVAYQRNETSGSQNFMHTFMGDTPLMEPVTEFVPFSMGMLMDAIAVYDNAENAIGYSVYAYAADMYGNGNEIKFIQVDGVAPTKATMAAGEYPLLGYNYAVYDSAAPADSSLRKLVAWLVTEEGQRAIQSAGYVPILPIGEGEPVFALYNEVGTGPEKPAGHLPALYQYTVGQEAWEGFENEKARLTGLKNKDFQQEINAFIEASGNEVGPTGYAVEYECINGYLSVAVWGTRPGLKREYRTALYDLVEEKRIVFSDLFFKGEEFTPALNRTLQEAMDEHDALGYEPPLKRPFAGLEAGHDAFALTRVLLDPRNPYLNGWKSVPLKGIGSMSVLWAPRDLAGVFEDSVPVTLSLATEGMYTTFQPGFGNGYFQIQLPSSAAYPEQVCDRYRAAALAVAQGEMSGESVAAYYGLSFIGWEGAGLYANLWGDRYIRLTGGYWYAFSPETEDFMEGYLGNIITCHIFSAETGEEVPYTDLIREGWQEEAAWYRIENRIFEDLYMLRWEEESLPKAEAPDLSLYRLADMDFMNGKLALAFQQTAPGGGTYIALLPPDWLKN